MNLIHLFLFFKIGKFDLNEITKILYSIFINLEIINNTIDIRNKSKTEIHNILESKEYPKLEIKENTGKSFDYLLKMDLFKLSKDEIEKLKKLHNEKETEVNTLEKKTINEIWIEELKQLKEKYIS